MTFVQSASANGDGSSTTLAVSLTGVGSGNLIVVYAGFFNEATTSMSVSDGTSTLTGLTQRHAGTNNHDGQWFYLLTANSGNLTYTVTYGAARSFRRIWVGEYSYTGTASFDVENFNNSDVTNVLAGGVITTTGTDELVLSSHQCHVGAHISSPQFDSVAADRTTQIGSNADVWDRILTATVSNKEASGTAGSAQWLSITASFIITGGGARGLFRTPPLSGIGIGGSFFRDPLQEVRT